MVAVNADCALGTFLGAYSAADTAVFAHCTGDFAQILRGAANGGKGRFLLKADKVIGTGFYTLAAGYAFSGIDNRNSVLYLDCALVADIYAVAEAYTAVRAAALAVIELFGGNAASCSRINIFILGSLIAAVTVNVSRHWLGFLHLYA